MYGLIFYRNRRVIRVHQLKKKKSFSSACYLAMTFSRYFYNTMNTFAPKIKFLA